MGNTYSGASKEWIENRLKQKDEQFEIRLKQFKNESSPTFEPLPDEDTSCPSGGVTMTIGKSKMIMCHGTDGVDGEDGPTPVVTPLVLGQDERCPQGGVEIDVNGNVDVVCAGKDGQVPTVGVAPLEDCPNGGTTMKVGKETVNICDGVDGEDGEDGDTPTLNPLGEGEHGCAEGGMEVTIGNNQSSVICAAADGKTPTVENASLDDCPFGGTKMTVGDSVVNVCHGQDGDDGEDGAPAKELTVEKLEIGDVNCPKGGVELFLEGVSQKRMCTAEDGKTPTTNVLAEGEGGCDLGGVGIYIGDDLKDVICYARDGEDGEDGAPAKEVSVKTLEPGSSRCPVAGGVEIFVGDKSQEVICTAQDGRTPTTKVLAAGEGGCDLGGVGLYTVNKMSVETLNEGGGGCTGTGGIDIRIGDKSRKTICVTDEGKEPMALVVPRGSEGCTEGGMAIYIGGEKSEVICNEPQLSDAICNARDGEDGEDGAPPNFEVRSIDLGDPRCTIRGGMEIFLNGVSQKHICTPENGKTPTTRPLKPNEEGCGGDGGVAILINDDISDVICNPKDGQDGEDGGDAPTPVVTPVEAGLDADCPDGGLRITVGEGDAAVSEVVCPKNGKAPKTQPINPGEECDFGGVKIINADGSIELLCSVQGPKGNVGLIGNRGPKGERGPPGERAPTVCRYGEYEEIPPAGVYDRKCTKCPQGYWFDKDKPVKTTNNKTCKYAWVDSENVPHTIENPCTYAPKTEGGASESEPWCQTTDDGTGVCQRSIEERCSKHTECGADEYEIVAPTKTIDRQCAKLADCAEQNKYIREWSKPDLNRVCAACDASQWIDTTTNKGRIKTTGGTGGGANCLPEFEHDGVTYKNTCVTPSNGGEPWCKTGSEGSTTLWGNCDESWRCKEPKKCDYKQREYIAREATPTEDTKCGKCGKSQWVDAEMRQCKSLLPCNASQGYYSTNEVNTAWQQRKCEQCPTGKYLSGGSCKTYKGCPAGQEIDFAGDKARDRTCKACPAGTFSGNGVKCQAHRPCPDGKILDKAGTSTADTKCKSCPRGQYATKIGFRLADKGEFAGTGGKGECKGTEVRMFESTSDNPGTNVAERIQACAQACLTKLPALNTRSWDTYPPVKGFALSGGRCYCESQDSATCSRSDNSYYRYDFYDLPETVCRNHQTCRPGTNVNTAGTSTTNTICHACPPNHYESGGKCYKKRSCAYTKSDGSATSNRVCHAPRNCAWSEWDEGDCNKCYKGKRDDTRTKTPAAAYGGRDCTGDASRKVDCNTSTTCSDRYSACYKDEQCSDNNRDNCIKDWCKQYGLKYSSSSGNWRDCGGWKFQGKCTKTGY